MRQPEIPQSIRANLKRLRRRERTLRLVAGAAQWAAWILAALALACTIDWLVDRRQDTPWALRAAMTGIQAVAAMVVFWRAIVRPLWGTLGIRELALWVERETPPLDHRLITTVELHLPGADTRGMSPELIAAVAAETEERCKSMRFADLADAKRMRRSALLAAAIALGWLVPLLACYDLTATLVLRQFLCDQEIPRRIMIEPLLVHQIRPAGEEVLLPFTAVGRNVSPTMVGEVVVERTSGVVERYPLTFALEKRPADAANPDGVAFTATVAPSDESFTYWAYLDDGRSHTPGTVVLEPRPAIVDLTSRVELPAYCGTRPDGKPYVYSQSQGDAIGLAGAAAHVEVSFQKPVAKARATIFGAPDSPDQKQGRPLREIPLALDPACQLARGSFSLKLDEVEYQITAEDRHGFGNLDPPRRIIRIVEEEPPTVALLPERLTDDEEESDEDFASLPVPQGGAIRVAYSANCRWGLRAAQLRYRINEGEWRTLPLGELKSPPSNGEFDVRRGAFSNSRPNDQIEFFAAPSDDPKEMPGRLFGGGRFDFQTGRIPGLKPADRIELAVEAFGSNPDPSRPPGRSESRVKPVVTRDEFVRLVADHLQTHSRLRGLETRQKSVFDPTAEANEPEPDDSPAAKAKRHTSRKSQNGIRVWQLLGPFANRNLHGIATVYPPETEEFDEHKQYDGLKGKIGWRKHYSNSDIVDLRKLMGVDEPAVAYAAAWISSDKARPVQLWLGSDDGIKVWLNGKLVFTHPEARSFEARKDSVVVELEKGDNELRVKVENQTADWMFAMEVVDPLTDEPVLGVSVRNQPPPPRRK